MTKFEFDTIQSKYSRALSSVRYLSQLYLTLKDLLNTTKPNDKYGPVKFEYSYNRDKSFGLLALAPNTIKTFEIIQYSGWKSPEDWVYESFPNGVGWSHPYDIKELPSVLKLVKRLKKVADYKYTLAENDLKLSYLEREKGLDKDPVATLQTILKYTSNVSYEDKKAIEDFLRGKGIEV